MSLKIVSNDGLTNCARFQVTDLSDVVVSDSKQLNVVGGGRHLSFAQTGTAQRRAAYVNKSIDFDVDTFVMTRADRHVGRDVQIGYWTSYPATWAAIEYSVSWAPTLVGYSSQDYVRSVSPVNAEALGVWLASTYAKTVGQIYWGKSLAIDCATNFVFKPFYRHQQLGRKTWPCSDMLSFTAQKLTRVEVERLETIADRREPLFLWDDGGMVLSDKLWHGVIADINVAPVFDDHYSVNLTFARLRGYQ